MRHPILPASALLLAAACVRPTPPGPAVWEEAVLGVRDDGTFLVAQASLAPSPEGAFRLISPGYPARRLETIQPALVARSLEKATGRGASGLRSELVGDEKVAALFVSQGLTAASPLAAEKPLSWAIPDRALTLRLSQERTATGAQVLAVEALDADHAVRLAEIPVLDDWWVTAAYRAGERVAVAAGSLGGAATRVEALTIVDLRRASARLAHEAGLAAYLNGDLPGAIAGFHRASLADPGFPDAPYDEACALALDHRPEESAERLARAIALDPVRIRQLANQDRDLVDLRRTPAIRERLGLLASPP